jgi:hypothetical protein
MCTDEETPAFSQLKAQVKLVCDVALSITLLIKTLPCRDQHLSSALCILIPELFAMAQQDGPIESIAEPGVKAQGQLLHEMRREVATLLNRSQTGFPGAQPVSFARQHLDELAQHE